MLKRLKVRRRINSKARYGGYCVYIPEIQETELAERLLRRYVGNQWQESHKEVPGSLVGQTGAFVRAVALYARLLALHEGVENISVERLKCSVQALTQQINSKGDFTPRRHISFRPDERRARLS
ncbi:MAG: hypothetical protein NZ571_02655 [Anaerolineae bacterium]|nr:hypothetical protein [Anaerolineae bacterium]